MELLEARQLMTALPLGATPYDTAEFMLGRVAVTPVLLESNGGIDPNTENWTSEEIATVLFNVRVGMQWWVDSLAKLNTVHSLEFVIDDSFATTPPETPYEPITRRSNDYNQYVGQFLLDQGFDGSGLTLDEAMREFNHAQREKLNTDWSFTIFVVDSSSDPDGRFEPTGSFSQAFAFAGGLFIVTPSGRPASTYTHETGHIFWARDEYPNSGSHNDKRGYYNTQNTNAIDDAPPGFIQQPSIMSSGLLLQQAYNNNTSPEPTFAQIGWQDSDGDGIFDVLDVPLDLDVAAVVEPGSQLLRVRGTASAVPLLNLNSSGQQNDITLNRVSRIEYRIDGGDWVTASTPDAQTVLVDLSINLAGILPAGGFQQIDLRAVDASTGITSNVVTVTPSGPTSGGGIVAAGFAFIDENEGEVWDAGDTLLSGVSVSITNPSGIFRGRLEPDDSPGEIYSELQDQFQIRSTGNQVDGRVSSLTGTAGTGTSNFHYGTVFGSWGDSWTAIKQELNITLNQSTSHASIIAIGKGTDSIGRLEGYDENGVLVARATSGFLGLGESATLELYDPAGRIQFLKAFGASGTSVSLDDFRFGPAITATSSVFGTFEFQNLPDGSYPLLIESPASQFEIVSSNQTLLVANGVAEPIVVIAKRTISRWTNPSNSLDVNDRDGVQPLDALIVINDLNRFGARELTESDSTPPYLDVNGDQSVTPLDALRIINFLNRQSGSGTPSGEGDGAYAAAGFLPTTALPLTPPPEQGDATRRPHLLAEGEEAARPIGPEIASAIDNVWREFGPQPRWLEQTNDRTVEFEIKRTASLTGNKTQWDLEAILDDLGEDEDRKSGVVENSRNLSEPIDSND